MMRMDHTFGFFTLVLTHFEVIGNVVGCVEIGHAIV